jgi:hypothetical protein
MSKFPGEPAMAFTTNRRQVLAAGGGGGGGVGVEEGGREGAPGR